ncbi:response regulator [Clostridiisalibacter paucivorans]|uniref:response regulator n=1 Tax=Clostridiisalibacter paucivorans TaxID=408753 RepID=UPI0004788081|nr:response regulator [Clostridiisalibacter paucivorans]
MEGINVLQKIKILYVEDEPITRNQVYRFLKKRVGKTITAENGEDGIRKFIEYKPDLIITDLVMPDMSGIEMMRKIRQQGFRCPFIITSALSDANTILETVDLKIEKYLIKPVNIDILMKNLVQIATEILEEKDLLVINNDFILTDDERRELEIEIRNLYSKYLKRVTGKGAKLINVFIKGKEIEIILKENLTTLEKNLLVTGEHYKNIEIVRKTVYESTMDQVEKQISDLINRRVKIQRIEICPKEKYERLLVDII